MSNENSKYIKLRTHKLLKAWTVVGKAVKMDAIVLHLPYLHCTASYREEVVRCLPARKPKCPGYWGFSVVQEHYQSPTLHN